jgi:hypothetical protein
MKRILSIFVSLIFLSASAQTQTFFGTKTFNSPPKFKNLVQNNLNAKVLTINTVDGLQWRDASSFVSPIPNFQQVTTGVANGFTSNNFGLVDGVNPLVEVKKIGDFGSIYVFNPLTEDEARVIPQAVSTSNGVNGHIVQLNSSGASESGLGVNTNGNGYSTWFKSDDTNQNVFLQSPKNSGRLALESNYKTYTATFNLTNNSGSYIFTLNEILEGDFTGFTYTYTPGPDRFRITATNGNFNGKRVRYIILDGSNLIFSGASFTPGTNYIEFYNPKKLLAIAPNYDHIAYKELPTVGPHSTVTIELKVYN